MRTIVVAVAAALLNISLVAGQAAPAKLKVGATIFIAPMDGGFDGYLKAAIEKKKVPVTIVSDRNQAESELKGSAESQKAGTAKKIFMQSWHSDEQASISVINVGSWRCRVRLCCEQAELRAWKAIYRGGLREAPQGGNRKGAVTESPQFTLAS